MKTRGTQGGNLHKEQNRTMCLCRRRRAKEKRDYETKRAARHISSGKLASSGLLRSGLEPLLCLTYQFLGLSKVLICGPSRDPSSGPPLLSSGDAARVKLPITLRGRFLGPYWLGRESKGVWAGRR
jgi:hypothetical protein